MKEFFICFSLLILNVHMHTPSVHNEWWWMWVMMLQWKQSENLTQQSNSVLLFLFLFIYFLLVCIEAHYITGGKTHRCMNRLATLEKCLFFELHIFFFVSLKTITKIHVSPHNIILFSSLSVRGSHTHKSHLHEKIQVYCLNIDLCITRAKTQTVASLSNCVYAVTLNLFCFFFIFK